MTTTSIAPGGAAETATPSSALAHALRALKVFAGAAVSVVLLGQHTQERPTV
ncbi:hypothetical protein AB0K89_18145 [Streptomyces cinnamoneus]|uniref:hypothetical protein n=1 Tax=Streptomyces cinnamoneus TaxID=53446 RepID=UPI00342139A1